MTNEMISLAWAGAEGANYRRVANREPRTQAADRWAGQTFSYAGAA